MKTIIAITLLAGTLASGAATAQSEQPPSEALDGVLSAGKPLSESEAAAAASQSKPQAGSATYTYLRCYYRLNPAANQPQTSYVWATDPSSGDYYRVNGYWWSGSLVALKNMFYSDVSQDTLRSVCQSTLAKQGINRPLALTAAANNALSYNHTIWTLDSAAQGSGINKMIVFGDSLSDTQNMYGASQWKLPTAKSWYIGRFSNGRVWVEHLADQLSLPVYNWAIGGAAADQHLVVPGLLQEVESWTQYMQKAPNYRPENSLFTMLIGGNDLLNYGRTVDQVIADQSKALEKVIAAGGRNIVVLNLPDLSRTPAGSSGGKAAQLAQQVKDYNLKLAALVANLQQKYGASLRLRQFDAYSMFNDLLTNPAKYQVSNATQSCLNIAANASLPYVSGQTPRAECGNADAYVFWDNLHPTTHTHLLLGNFVADFVRQQGYPLSLQAKMKARRR
ncbi:SGNH/GDSL hydrolase family protein [Chromobacterium sp. IIBBL 290-4]|uniref:SGNH/GDSL hydrolase family protein n=1 Tax=Chromobacterium sp. IIBBL 290-4 TaxID=2953890 RepID=UPI0020B8B4A2|nr:SGNH/GDSL hydrolase family protein [Chromobacterium sp. IIBBL 290-4]UTH76038.1 SGNH/GDSL hydrolase family protein [Chromobacterium sp. IIBBL 290-4]